MAEKKARRQRRPEGQIIERGGAFLARVYVGLDPETGRRRYRSQTVRGDEKAAKRILADMLAKAARGEELEPAKQTVTAFLDDWLQAHAARVRPQTLDNYRRVIAYYVKPALGPIVVGRLTPLQVQKWHAQLLGRGLSARTVQLAHTMLEGALGQALRWGILGRNVAAMVDPPRGIRRRMPVFTVAESGRFLEAAAQDGQLGRLYILLLTTGLRPSEALGLTWNDVDLDGRRVHIVRTLIRLKGGGAGAWELQDATKTPAGRRMIELPELAVEALRAQQDARAVMADAGRAPGYEARGFVFETALGQPLGERHVARHFQTLLGWAGLPKLRLYDLRHSHATLLLAQGVHPKVVSERLGHSRVGITLDTYSHVLPGMQRAAADLVDKAFGQPALTAGRRDPAANSHTNSHTADQEKEAGPGPQTAPDLRFCLVEPEGIEPSTS